MKIEKSITLRKGRIEDVAELKQLFVGTVTSICIPDYDLRQISAWISSVEDEERWNEIITNQFVLVAQDADEIVGFATLAKKNHLDLLYVHKNHQKKGVGNKLYVGVEEEAERLGQDELTSDVSKTAKSFFDKVGFRTISEQTVVRRGIKLINFKMKKKLMKEVRSEF